METSIDVLISKVKENPFIFEAESNDVVSVLSGLHSKLKYCPKLFKNMEDLKWLYTFFEHIDKNEKIRNLLKNTIELVKLIKK
jgi:hypothetical protein